MEPITVPLETLELITDKGLRPRDVDSHRKSHDGVVRKGSTRKKSDPTVLLYERDDGTIIYIVLELGRASPTRLVDARADIERLRALFRQSNPAASPRNNGYVPPLLVVGRRLPPEFRSDMLNQGVRVFDLDQPSNERFLSAQDIVVHLMTMVEPLDDRSERTVPKPPRGDATRTKNDLDGYYKSINDKKTLTQFIEFINNPKTSG